MENHAGRGKTCGQRQGVSLRWWLVLALAVTVGVTGCNRKFYRQRADREVANVLAEKDRFPQWRIEQFHVYPDPHARFADPANPDRPPMPPDDPAAYLLSPKPQRPGKAGVGRVTGTGYLDVLAAWDAENRTARAKEEAADPNKPKEGMTSPYQATSPEIRLASAEAQISPKPESGDAQPESGQKKPADGEKKAAAPKSFLITLEQAVELGLINSRDYQNRREDLYLTALPVTLERYAFAAQFTALTEAIRERTGRLTPEGQRNRWRVNSSAGMSKLFSTGALLLFRFANLTVLELTGNRKHTVSTSDLSLDLVQPLLQGGGRAVTLEPLTQTERNLLYEIRRYARFRKEFYVAVAGGVNISGPVGDPPEGYLPTLFLAVQLENERKNVARLEDNLIFFRAFAEGGDLTQLDVDQVEQQLLRSRGNVLVREVAYLDGLDRFKLQLGLPTDLPLELDDGPLREIARPFRGYEELIADIDRGRSAIEKIRVDNTEQFVREQVLGILSGFLAVNPLMPDPLLLSGAGQFSGLQLMPGILAAPLRDQLRRFLEFTDLVEGTQFRQDFLRHWAEWSPPLADEVLRKRLEEAGQRRRDLLDKKTALEIKGQALGAEDVRLLDRITAEIDLGLFERALRYYESMPWRSEPSPERRFRLFTGAITDVLNGLILVLGEARNERLAQIGRSWPELPAVTVEGIDLITADLEQAVNVAARTALLNRFDLMNARALLVDAWRQVAVFANDLLGVFNVQYHFDSTTPPLQAKPLAFAASRSRHQLILNGELPLIRKPERNNYRATLIAYQRQRRALMAAEDRVVFDVRQEIRRLRQLAENYKIQRRVAELAYVNVENSIDAIRQPPTPGAQLGARDAAGQTTRLLQNQQALVNAQNQVYGIWVDFRTTRLQLYRDLELMPLDFRGVWSNEFAASPASGPPGTNPLPLAGSGDPVQPQCDPQPETGQHPQWLPEPRALPPAAEGPQPGEGR